MKPAAWAMLAALTWGVAPLLEKLGLMKMTVYPGLFLRSLGVVIGLVFLILWKYETISSSLTHVSWIWIYPILGGILASVVGQIFFHNALKSGEASQVVPIGAAYPLISFVLGILFLGEKITLAKLAGLIFVLTGVILLK